MLDIHEGLTRTVVPVSLRDKPGLRLDFPLGMSTHFGYGKRGKGQLQLPSCRFVEKWQLGDLVISTTFVLSHVLPIGASLLNTCTCALINKAIVGRGCNLHW